MSDDARGKAKHVGGKIQEKAGEILGDREMQRKGRLSQIEGEAEQDEERAEEEAREARERKRAAKLEKSRIR
jgi:uncharacterized protein YjbJ (UPF0337 family)